MTAIPTGERWLFASLGIFTVVVGQLLITQINERAYVRSLTSVPALSALGSDSAVTVALLLRLDDCAGNIEALRHWNVAAQSGGVRVRALVLGTPDDSAALNDILGGTGIRYSIRGTTDQAIDRTLRSLGHVTTPLAIVVDRQLQVRLILPVPETISRESVRGIVAYAATLAGPVPTTIVAATETAGSAPIQVARASARPERFLSRWDTAWVWPAGNREATLVIRVSPAGVHVFDATEKRLTLLSSVGKPVWQFDGRTSSAARLGEIRDIEVDKLGRSYLLDAQNKKIVVLDRWGRLTGDVATDAVGHPEQLVVVDAEKFLLYSPESLRLPGVNAAGHLVSNEFINWPDLADVQPIARQLVIAGDPLHERWVLASLVGTGWVVVDNSRDTRVFPFLENRPLPTVRTTVIGDSSYTRFVQYAGCTACDIAVADSSFYMLTGGTAATAKEVIDRYDLRTGRYVESFRFGTRLQSFAVDGDRLYIVTEDPRTMLVAWDRKTLRGSVANVLGRAH